MVRFEFTHYEHGTEAPGTVCFIYDGEKRFPIGIGHSRLHPNDTLDINIGRYHSSERAIRYAAPRHGRFDSTSVLARSLLRDILFRQYPDLAKWVQNEHS
jgi:hypothetical protein